MNATAQDAQDTAADNTAVHSTAAGMKSIENALHARFLRGLETSPGRTALRYLGGEIGYEALHRLALQWAGSLLAALPEPPKAIGVLAGKSLEAYAGVLAALYTGAAVVPMHPDFPASRTRRMIELSGISALIADEAGREVWAQVRGDGLDLPLLEPDRLDPADALGAPRPAAPGDPAYLLFTSGSTGVPKGVPVSHGSTKHYFDLLDGRYDFRPDDVFSQTFDLNFDCSVFDLFCAWGAGATVQSVPPKAYLDMPAFLAQQGVTVWFSTPSAITLLRKMGGLGPGALPAALRWSFFAGEALRCADAADWQAAAAGSAVENIYGPTELTITVSGYRWDPEATPALGVNGLVPIGQVHPGHDFLFLTEEGGIDETEGELCITGPQMTRGYLDPEHDLGRFLHHGGRVWYRTGDRVRDLGGGELAYLGRLDSQVQVQGWRVELAEVENAVRTCEGVLDAVTVVREADGVTELVVFYTGERVPGTRLTRSLREVLPDGMLPRDYRRLDEFPLNSNRKIDRGLLARMATETAQPHAPSAAARVGAAV